MHLRPDAETVDAIKSDSNAQGFSIANDYIDCVVNSLQKISLNIEHMHAITKT